MSATFNGRFPEASRLVTILAKLWLDPTFLADVRRPFIFATFLGDSFFLRTYRTSSRVALRVLAKLDTLREIARPSGL